ncbi:VF530 family DNA-binding protein [Catenovulum sediminis]|uniref:VF530 family protein n=1 Tax=Catenovulum sediminis TaxID=1740262 RepID=A0ABV1RKF5_9ALTE|nr:VF530 family protein [Catenovulum sediminis]
MAFAHRDPLHGVKLEDILRKLEAEIGWQGMSACVDINCFKKDPSIKSSLKFLRRTPWARAKVEQLYIETFHKNDSPWGSWP